MGTLYNEYIAFLILPLLRFLLNIAAVNPSRSTLSNTQVQWRITSRMRGKAYHHLWVSLLHDLSLLVITVIS